MQRNILIVELSLADEFLLRTLFERFNGTARPIQLAELFACRRSRMQHRLAKLSTDGYLVRNEIAHQHVEYTLKDGLNLERYS